MMDSRQGHVTPELPSDQPKHFEATSGIEPLLRVLQTL